MTCTCTPLNRALMAPLLGVEPGSVHEQGCLEQAADEARADLLDRLAAGVRELPAEALTFRVPSTGEVYSVPVPGDVLDRAAVLSLIEEARK
jgi:hypothetical protein